MEWPPLCDERPEGKTVDWVVWISFSFQFGGSVSQRTVGYSGEGERDLREGGMGDKEDVRSTTAGIHEG